MRHLPVRGPCLALLTAVTIAGRARAQVSIEVAPLAGLYASMNDFPAPSSFFPTGPDRWKLATGLTYGGQGTLWLGPVGVVASYSGPQSLIYKVHLGRGGTSFGQATEVDLVGRAGVILRII